MNELVRDNISNRIISYLDERSSENKGRIELPVVDERFLANDFDFIIKTKFSSLKDAVDAEKNVFNQIETIQTGLLRGIPIGNLSPSDMQNIQSIAKNELLQNLQNIAENNPNSIESLNKKIRDLEDLVERQNNELADWATNEIRWQQKIDIWADQYEGQSIRADAMERMNTELSSQQEQILTDLTTRIETDKIRTENILNAMAERTSETLGSLAKDVDSLKNFKSDFVSENEFGLSRMSELIKNDYFGTAGTAGTSGTSGDG
jgi:predicted RNase H-like nuclease (RuvC/YqgF family)